MNPDAAAHKPTLKFDADARFAIRLHAEAAWGQRRSPARPFCKFDKRKKGQKFERS